METIRVGIVGTGFISSYHYDAFQRNSNAVVTSMCTNSNITKLEYLCQKWGIKPYYSFDEMVEDPDIDALVITSINTEHYTQIIKAIENKKHCLVEKPVVTNLEEYDEIINKARGANVVVFPGHNHIYRQALKEAKKIIESGVLGKIIYSSFMGVHKISNEIAMGWRGNKSLSCGGALMDSGHHQVYMSLYLLGMPKKLQAFKSRLVFNNINCEDIAQVNVLYDDNSIGAIMQSWTSDYADGINGIKIMGEKGQIVLTDALYYNGEKMNTEVGYYKSFLNQTEVFVNCVLGKDKPLSTLEDAKNSLKLIYAAYKSSEKDEVVVLS